MYRLLTNTLSPPLRIFPGPRKSPGKEDQGLWTQRRRSSGPKTKVFGPLKPRSLGPKTKFFGPKGQCLWARQKQIIEYSILCHTQHSQDVPCVPTVDKHPFSSSANFPRAPKITPGRKTRVFGPKDQGLWAQRPRSLGHSNQGLWGQRPSSLDPKARVFGRARSKSLNIQ